MATFISITTDAFDTPQERPSYQHVRRPVRGIQLKEETFAVIRVLTARNEEISLIDSGSPTYDESEIGRSGLLSNFLLQDVQEQRTEKQQIVETFGEDYIFFFGERPRFLRFSGLLMNTADFNWKSEWWENYENNLRGSKLVELNARLYVYFDDVVVEGYILDSATTWSAGTPYSVPFQFTLFVTNYAHLSRVGHIRFQPQQDPVFASPEAELAALEKEGTVAAISGGQGNLNAVLAQYQTTATFGIQTTLNNLRNTFLNRRIVASTSLASQAQLDPIGNLAQVKPPQQGRPIHEMNDEYVVRPPTDPNFDQMEIDRVTRALKLRDPEELDKRVRADLRAMGVLVEDRGTVAMILGRGSFSGSKRAMSFGVKQVGGQLTPP